MTSGSWDDAEDACSNEDISAIRQAEEELAKLTKQMESKGSARMLKEEVDEEDDVTVSLSATHNGGGRCIPVRADKGKAPNCNERGGEIT